MSIKTPTWAAQSLPQSLKNMKGVITMTREMQKLVKKRKAEAAALVRFANPKSRTRPKIETITEILSRKIPYDFSEGNPEIISIEVISFSRNRIIKAAYFKVKISSGKVWEISAYENLTGRTPEEKEADKTATFPSGLYNVFRRDITEMENGGRHNRCPTT